MTDLWLVRHGQTDWNLTGRWQGQASDAPGLNDAGQAQVLTICEQLKGIKFSAIYSSDLLRARQTAEMVAESLGLSVTLELRLREINLGEWRGCLRKRLKRSIQRNWQRECKIPFMNARQMENHRTKWLTVCLCQLMKL